MPLDSNKPKKCDTKTYAAIQEFTLMSDLFMSVVFGNRACTKVLIDTILQKDLEITELYTQYKISNLYGHSVILDIWARDKNDNIYNIEVQNADNGAVPERARYISSIIDARELKKDENWKKLPETYVIFITKNDVLKGGEPIYHIERGVVELRHKAFNDRQHIIYVNGEIQDETDLGRLMHDMNCKKAEDIFNRELSETVYHYKNDDEGVSYVCDVMEDYMKDYTRKAVTEAVSEAVVASIKNVMRNAGLTLDGAMDLLGVSAEDREMYTKLVKA